MNLRDILKKALNNPAKIPQAFKIELKSLAVILKYGLPDISLEFLGGLGDELLLSVVAQEMKKRNAALRIWQISNAAELLFNNPCYSMVFNAKDYWYLPYTNLLNKKRCKINGYVNAIVPGEKLEPPVEHLAAVMCRKAGIKGKVLIKPNVYLTKEEIEYSHFSKGAVIVSYPGKDSYAHMKNNRLWDITKFQYVMDTLSSGKLDGNKYKIIQLGNIKDPLLKGVADLRGKTTMRESAAILSNSEFFLGFEGFLMHLTRSVGKRSVIIYGGFAHSWQTGYPCNENIDSFVECAPCWQPNHCERDLVCLSSIETDDVLRAIQRLLAKESKKLEIEEVLI